MRFCKKKERKKDGVSKQNARRSLKKKRQKKVVRETQKKTLLNAKQKDVAKKKNVYTIRCQWVPATQ